MAECCVTPVGCLKDIGKNIFTQCLWPPIKSHIDYWWCFDNNIQVLRDEVRHLESETVDINQRIEQARLRTENPRPEAEKWLKTGTEKLGEVSKFFQHDINPKAWSLISRYLMGKRAKKAAEDIAKHRNDGNFNPIAYPAPPPATRLIPHRSAMDFESRKHIEEEIIKSLKKSIVDMIGICGMGGVGKTTMAKRIGERVLKEKLFDEVVLVVVSQPPIDILKIQEEIAESLGLKFDVKGMLARAHQLCTRLEDPKRKLIIFDDVWETLKFEDLGVPFERCKVLLTSRSTDTCKGIKNKKVFKLKILEEEEAWILFKEKAGKCVEDPALFSVAKEVAAECNGLPLALVTVGTALQDEMNRYKWKDSLSQLRRSNPTYFPEVLAHVYKPLKLSYDYLDNDSERDILLLCCLFPEDYNIPIQQLTSYSIGLRLLDGMSSIEEARNRMHALIERLKSRFLLIDSYSWKEEFSVRMHDIVRDVAIYIGSTERNGFLKCQNKTSKESSSDAECNWMSVDISNERMKIPVASHFPNLRLLMLLESSSNEFSNISFQGMEELNVLSFLSTWIESLPPTLGLLKNLQTLCLFQCEVENISVIGELTSLDIFICNGCKNITELPAEIGRLNHLRLLELNECSNLQRIPFGIFSSLVRLEELKMLKSFDGWEAEENGKETKNASLTELEFLRNLTCLEIAITDSNLAAQQISLSPKLVKYRVRIGFNDDWYNEEHREKVMELKLPSDIGAVGKWILILLKNTEYLRLQGNGSNKIINLQECQNLRNLEFGECSMVKKLVETKDCKSGIVFPLLERLCLERLDNLEEICDGTIIIKQNVSSLCNLKSLEIRNCSNLRYIFTVSVARRCLLQLEVLRIDECEAMEQVFRNEIRDDTDGCIEFPKLKYLRLENLPNLTSFCQGLENIKFPNLTKLIIGDLPKLKSFCPLDSETPHDDGTPFHFLCNPKVEMGGFEYLSLGDLGNNIRNIWCEQIPINVFNNLQTLDIWHMKGGRSLLPYSVAKTLVSLKVLYIYYCEEMVEVIEDNDDDKKVVDINCLFPTLETLSIQHSHKLRRFWQWSGALELPLLNAVHIIGCPLMETFTSGFLNTPNLKMLEINLRGIDDMKDLNDAIHHYFTTTKSESTSMIDEEENDKDEDANKDEENDENEDLNQDEDASKDKDVNEAKRK